MRCYTTLWNIWPPFCLTVADEPPFYASLHTRQFQHLDQHVFIWLQRTTKKHWLPATSDDSWLWLCLTGLYRRYTGIQPMCRRSDFDCVCVTVLYRRYTRHSADVPAFWLCVSVTVLYRRYTRHSADVSAFWLWLCVWLACTDVTGTLTVFGCLVQTLHEAFSRCASVLSHSSQPDDVAVQVNHCHCGQIGYQSQRAGRNGWLRAVEARMRVVGGESSGWFSVTEDEKLRVKFGAKELSFLRCFDTAGWATGSHVACINLFQLSANTLFWGLSQTAVTPEKKKAG